jgi:pimeloyl-ACP methyl ester carboxylesterase
MAALIPGATLVIMPGTGHFAPFARPALFSQIVLDYLDGKTLAMASTPIPGTPVP